MTSYRWFGRWYRLCEKVVFGGALQRCRTAFLDEMHGVVLSVGEGDGRFAEAALGKGLEVLVVEPDVEMRRLARSRNSEVRFVELGDVEQCDVVVLNFVLDCFSEENAGTFLDSLPRTEVIVAGDFFPEEVPSGFRRWGARRLVRVMYLWFRCMVGLRTQGLPPVAKLLGERGWTKTEEKCQWRGFIRAQKWQRR